MEGSVGERIREVRRAQNKTQKELAAATQLDVMTISRLEKGKAKGVYAETVVALARALRVTTDYLLGLTDAPP